MAVPQKLKTGLSNDLAIPLLGIKQLKTGIQIFVKLCS